MIKSTHRSSPALKTTSEWLWGFLHALTPLWNVHSGQTGWEDWAPSRHEAEGRVCSGKRRRGQLFGRCILTHCPPACSRPWTIKGLGTFVLDPIRGQARSMGHFSKWRRESLKTKQKDWIHFCPASYKQHKAYLSSLLTQEHNVWKCLVFLFYSKLNFQA